MATSTSLLQGGSPTTLQAPKTTIQGSSPLLQGSSLSVQNPATTGSLIQPQTSPAPTPYPSGQPDAVDVQQKQINDLLAQLAAGNRQVYAPALDVNGIFKNAESTAASNVNPYYTKLLNDFVSQQAQARALREQQTKTNIQTLQDQLQQNLAANDVARTRAAEDATTQDASIATAADQRQQDQGTSFDQSRLAQADNLATRGLTGSGLAGKEQGAARTTFTTTEARQAASDQRAKDAVALSKARTFEDLATSGANATKAEKAGEQQAQFDLNSFILGQTNDLQAQQQSLEAQRQQALANERTNQVRLSVQNFINSIANPAQRQAAISAYGGYL